MANKILEGMESNSFPTQEIITILIFAFGLLMFLGGFALGQYIEHQKVDQDMQWYQDHCRCSEYEIIVKPNLNHTTRVVP